VGRAARGDKREYQGGFAPEGRSEMKTEEEIVPVVSTPKERKNCVLHKEARR